MKSGKPWAMISFVTVYLCCMVLVVIRWLNLFQKEILVVNETVNSHITNFTLSVLICTLIGFLLLAGGKSYKPVLAMGLSVIAINMIHESILPFWDTLDLIDAAYGTVGTLLSLLYLFFIHRYGFVSQSQANQSVA